MVEAQQRPQNLIPDREATFSLTDRIDRANTHGNQTLTKTFIRASDLRLSETSGPAAMFGIQQLSLANSILVTAIHKFNLGGGEGLGQGILESLGLVTHRQFNPWNHESSCTR